MKYTLIVKGANAMYCLQGSAQVTLCVGRDVLSGALDSDTAVVPEIFGPQRHPSLHFEIAPKPSRYTFLPGLGQPIFEIVNSFRLDLDVLYNDSRTTPE